jgi:hypothetical protein
LGHVILPGPIARFFLREALRASDARHHRISSVPSVVYGPTPFNMGGPDENVLSVELLATAKVHALAAFDFLASGYIKDIGPYFSGKKFMLKHMEIGIAKIVPLRLPLFPRVLGFSRDVGPSVARTEISIIASELHISEPLSAAVDFVFDLCA